MKLFFEDYDPQFEFEADVRADVFNALHKVAKFYSRKGFSGEELQHAFDIAVEWFMNQAFDEEGLIEAIVNGKEVDLTNKEKTIAYGLHTPEIYDQIQEIGLKAEMGEMSSSEACEKMMKLVDQLPNVSEPQKRKAKVALFNAKGKSPHYLQTIIGTYLMGQNSKGFTGRKYDH